MAKKFVSVENLTNEVSESIGMFDKILGNLTAASQKIDAQITERRVEIDRLQKEQESLEKLGNKANSITEKIKALLS